MTGRVAFEIDASMMMVVVSLAAARLAEAPIAAS